MKTYTQAQVRTIIDGIFNMLDGKPHNLGAILEPYAKPVPGITERKPKPVTIKATAQSDFEFGVPIEIMAESKPRDQHKAGKLSHLKMVEKIRLAAGVQALINWTNRTADTGHIHYAKNAKPWLQQQGYARIIRVEGKTDSDYVEISTTWLSTKHRYDMIYRKTWGEWRAIWRETLPFVQKHASGK